MDTPATQLLSDEDDGGTHNLIIDSATTQERVHQVGTLWIGKQKYPIFEGINKVGRNSSSDIYLTDNTVSKNHAEIEAHANSAFVCDLGSSNKTRLNNVILRPQRFYQVDDGTELTFGNIKARYLFLRGFDNSILVPNTPAPRAKFCRNAVKFSKNSNNSLINRSDEESVIVSTQPQNNDDGIFAIPSPRSRHTRIHNRSVRVQVDATEISIHDVATQQYEQPEDHDESIHNCQTQRMSEFKISETHQSIHDLETQKFDTIDDTDRNAVKRKVGESIEKHPQTIYELQTQTLHTADKPYGNVISKKHNLFRKGEQSIHDVNTQKFNEIEELNSNISFKKCNQFKIGLQSIHDIETQKLDIVEEMQLNHDNNRIHTDEALRFHSEANVGTIANKRNQDQRAMNKNVRVNNGTSNEVDIDGETATSKDSLPNTSSSHHIINETDDESETDEEGVFRHIQIDNAKDKSEQSLDRIHDSDSETDEDGEFEAMRDNYKTRPTNSNREVHDGGNHISSDTIATGRIQIRDDTRSPCLNERFECQSPIRPHLDQLCTGQIENMVDNADGDPSLAPTQMAQKIQIIDENNEIINSDDDDDNDVPTQCLENLKKKHETNLTNEDENSHDEMPVTPPKSTLSNRQSVESMKKSLVTNTIPDDNDDDDDNDTESTQIVEIPKIIMPVQQLPEVNDDDDDDNIESTQVMQSPRGEAVTKKIAKSNQLGINGDETTVHKGIRRIIIENSSDNEDDTTQIISEPVKIVTENNKAPSKNDNTKCAGRIELSQNVSKRRSVLWDDTYFDDTTPTQVIDVQAAKIQAQDAESKSVTRNRGPRDHEPNDENDAEMLNYKTPVKLMKKPRMSLRLQRNNTSLNDSVTNNLVTLFGGESEENKIGVPSPMATQQLQDVLENADFNVNKKTTRSQSANKLNQSSSLDTDSQDAYFAKLHSKRKHNVISSSQDSTESENENQTSPPPPPKSFVFAAGTSGFKDGVAISNEERVGICGSPTKRRRGTLELQDNAKGEKKTGLSNSRIVPGNDGIANVAVSTVKVKSAGKVSGQEEKQENEEDDILAGLPEVKIYGTASYPASPTSSVCSLDDLELFERKRRERLDASAAKKALTRNKSLSRVSLDKVQRIESADVNKTPESSDDEELNYEDLKKMAVGFIAADTRTKKFSIKLEKITNTGNYRTISEDVTKQEPVSSTVKPEVLPRKRRGRPKKNIDPVLISQDEKDNTTSDRSIEEALPRKRARLLKDPANGSLSNSNRSAESQEVEMILEKNMSEVGRRRTKKLAVKSQNSETDLEHNQLTPHKTRKNEVKVIDSPSAISRRMKHKVLFTGLPGTNYEAEVKLCGGTIIQRSEQATILVTDKIRRTNKFFCAISRHIPIVSESWIEDSAEQKTFIDWHEYILEDPVTEAKYNFKLRESLERASRKKLFEGFAFIITPKVTQPGFEEIKSMVHMSGGKALVRAPKLWLANTIIISCTEDIPKLQDILSKVPNKILPRVHTVEFILLGILKQELDYKANQIKLPGIYDHSN